MKEKILTVLKSKQVKTAAWQTANGITLLLIAIATQLEPEVIDLVGITAFSVALAALNFITKEINKRYL